MVGVLPICGKRYLTFRVYICRYMFPAAFEHNASLLYIDPHNTGVIFLYIYIYISWLRSLIVFPSFAVTTEEVQRRFRESSFTRSLIRIRQRKIASFHAKLKTAPKPRRIGGNTALGSTHGNEILLCAVVGSNRLFKMCVLCLRSAEMKPRGIVVRREKRRKRSKDKRCNFEVKTVM